MITVYLGLGSNIEPALEYLSRGLSALQAQPRISLLATSAVYHSAAIGPQQADYLNLAILIATDLEPLALLSLCQEIESAQGRVRGERWGPRTLDIDLLYSPNVSCDCENLTMPHPELHRRLFVLAPLLELPRADTITVQGVTIDHYAAQMSSDEVCLSSYRWDGIQFRDTSTV